MNRIDRNKGNKKQHESSSKSISDPEKSSETESQEHEESEKSHEEHENEENEENEEDVESYEESPEKKSYKISSKAFSDKEKKTYEITIKRLMEEKQNLKHKLKTSIELSENLTKKYNERIREVEDLRQIIRKKDIQAEEKPEYEPSKNPKLLQNAIISLQKRLDEKTGDCEKLDRMYKNACKDSMEKIRKCEKVITSLKNICDTKTALLNEIQQKYNDSKMFTDQDFKEKLEKEVEKMRLEKDTTILELKTHLEILEKKVQTYDHKFQEQAELHRKIQSNVDGEKEMKISEMEEVYTKEIERLKDRYEGENNETKRKYTELLRNELAKMENHIKEMELYYKNISDSAEDILKKENERLSLENEQLTRQVKEFQRSNPQFSLFRLSYEKKLGEQTEINHELSQKIAFLEGNIKRLQMTLVMVAENDKQKYQKYENNLLEKDTRIYNLEKTIESLRYKEVEM